jgi:hypothetical protein
VVWGCVDEICATVDPEYRISVAIIRDERRGAKLVFGSKQFVFRSPKRLGQNVKGTGIAWPIAGCRAPGVASGITEPWTDLEL